MLTLSFDPHAEKDALATALRGFRARWALNRSAEAVSALGKAVERAEAVGVELEQSPQAPCSELTLVSILVHLLLAAARAELAHAQQYPVTSPLLILPGGTRPRCPSCEAERSQQRPEEPQEVAGASAPALSAGTLLSCPQCEEGLYTVTAPSSVDDLVLDDGILLRPLNTTIPQREAWRALACPSCGGRYYKDGKLHTLQRGWV